MNDMGGDDDVIRIDKWLWAVRVFKTRSQAAEACKKGRVIIDGVAVKPSRIAKVGEVIAVRKPPVIYTYRVKGLLSNRVSAKLASEYYENLTPEDELKKLKVNLMDVFGSRDRGAGRPTKKERRIIDKFKNI